MTEKTPKTPDITALINQLNSRLEAIASQHPPDWVWPLAYYKFDWPKRIGATILESDGHGASKVIWCGHCYTRRTGDKKYGTAIWFSRSVGNGEYGRLITFRDTDPALSLPDYIVRALGRSHAMISANTIQSKA